MKKILSIAVTFIIVFSMFSMFAPQVKAEGSPLEVDPFNYQGTYVINTTELSSREKTALSFVQKYAIKYAISPALVMAIIKQESDFFDYRKDPNKDPDWFDVGYMQVSYGAAIDTYGEYTGDEYKGSKEQWQTTDGLDPKTNVKYGTRYLRIQHDRIEDGCSGYEDVYHDILKSTISAYNAGLPDLSNENNYVNPVLEYYEDYKDKYYSGVELDWPAGKPNICRHPWDGFIDFEDGTDEAVIRSTIPGLEFTTTLGLDWLYGDIRTGKYNVYPYGHQGYETNGYFFAWLGVTGDQGRIDFPQGTATYLSVLVSTSSGVKIDAYDAEGNFLATSGWAENNLHTRTFTRLTVEVPGMAYVIVHDAGNYWLIDDLCTDAPGVLRAHYEAAELAKAVIGKNYLTQLYNVFTKGWKDGKFVEPGEVEYLDCSGLVFWSYDKAYGAEKYLGKGNPVTYEGADGQYQNNFDVTVSEDELLPGDVLFFDWDGDGYMDHVAMYVGEYKWKGEIQKLKYYTTGGVLRQKTSQPIVMTEKIGTVEYDGTYNVVHASGDAGYSYSIRPDTVDRLKMLDGFVEFRRLTEPKVGAEFKSYSPVDLIVTDPDGFTITKEIHEIPGVLYYSEWDIDGDGELDDMVIAPERKIGDYLITVVPEPEASPTDTYCLEVSADGETVVLAEDVQISDVPSQPYIIESTETEEFYVWQYVFEDSYGRGTTLKINTEHKFFKFIAPDKEFSIKEPCKMKVYNHAIILWHKDDEIKIFAVSVDTKIDFCFAYAKDMETGKRYFLIDKPGIE